MNSNCNGSQPPRADNDMLRTYADAYYVLVGEHECLKRMYDSQAQEVARMRACLLNMEVEAPAALAVTNPPGNGPNRDPRISSRGNRRSGPVGIPQSSPLRDPRQEPTVNARASPAGSTPQTEDSGQHTGGSSASDSKKGHIMLFFDLDPANELKMGSVACKHLWKDSVAATSVDWSWCGELLALACDGTIVVRRPADGAEVTRVDTRMGGTTFQAKFGADSVTVVSACSEGVFVWCAKTGAVRHQLRGAPAYGVCTSGSGHFATGDGEKIVRVWNGAGQLVRSMGDSTTHGVCVRALSFVPGCSLLAAGADDGSLRLWDVESGGVARTLEPHKGAVCGAVHSSDGRAMVTGASDGEVHVWDMRCSAPALTLHHLGAVCDVAYAPSSRWVLSGGADCAVAWWDLRMGKITLRMGMHDAPAVGVAHSPVGKEFAVAEALGQCRVWTYSV